jgi:hypothetical protein
MRSAAAASGRIIEVFILISDPVQAA